MLFLIRLQDKELVFKGEITAFLALIFIMMLSVVGALVESASIQIAKNRKRADTILAVESMFAEYNCEMLNQYELFVRFGSSEDVLCNRLDYYGAGNMTHTIVRLELLTDNGGDPFYQQAVRYMKDWLGMQNISPDVEYDFALDSYLDEEEKAVSQELENLLEQEGAGLPEENNPLETVQNLKNSGLLTILVSNPEELSNQSIKVETLPSARNLQKGNFGEPSSGGASDKLFFVAYLTEHFGNMVENDTSDSLLYELEYLLGGKGSDQENLEVVCKKILAIRMIANYGYLLTDDTKRGEAEALATVLCSLLTVPEATEVVKHALLLAWAYGESLVDVRALLKEKKVPAVKSAETWQLTLSNLIKLGTSDEVIDKVDSSEGLTYQDYLKGLLLFENKETLSMRALDLIESNLHIKADQCMTKVEIKSRVELRRGIQDTFSTVFGYQ